MAASSKNHDSPGRVPIPWSNRLEDLLRGFLPFTVWILAGLGCIWLWNAN